MGLQQRIYAGLVICTSTVLCLMLAPLALASQEEDVKAITSYTMGIIHDLNGDVDEAVSAYEHSSKVKPALAVRLRLGADYARLGRLDEAAQELESLLKEDPDNVQGRYLLALIYTTRKEYDKAAKEYEVILNSLSKADPKNIEIYGYLAQLYYSQKQYDKAIKEFEIILSLNPTENADLVYLLGTLYLETKNKSKALELFNRALKIDPNHDEALNSLGYMYAEDGDKLDEAKVLIEKAVKLDPRNGAYLDSLGWVYFKKGDLKKALEYLIQADAYLKDPIIYEHLGDVYFKMGDKQSAKKFWTLSNKLQPDQNEVNEKLKSLGAI